MMSGLILCELREFPYLLLPRACDGSEIIRKLFFLEEEFAGK